MQISIRILTGTGIGALVDSTCTCLSTRLNRKGRVARNIHCRKHNKHINITISGEYYLMIEKIHIASEPGYAVH
jgi:hypothetical protein